MSVRPSPRVECTAEARAREAYGRLPLSFEANVGQTDGRVQFLSRGAGYRLFLTAGEAVLDLSGAGERGSRKAALVAERLGGQGVRGLEQKGQREVVRWKFAGGIREVRGSGLLPLENRSNYFIGRDAKKWRTGIVNYQRVEYRGIYKGVDLVYYGREGRLEYDLVVAPGADTRPIRMDFAGVRELKLDQDGSLLLRTASGGTITQPKPFIYQEVDGTRRIVEGRYVLKGRQGVGFELEEYDRTRPLVIDPTLVYSSYLAGSGADEATSLAVDAAGNAYVTGLTDSPDFPATNSSAQATQGGGKDAFVVKLNATGTAVIYATYLGGALDDEGYGVALGPAGSVYVVGTTASLNFPTTVGALQTSAGGNSDAFVARLNANGSALDYGTYLGGNSFEEGFGLAVNAAGEAYVTGLTASHNFRTTNGALQSVLNGPLDAFVTKLNAQGTGVSYSTYLGGGGAEIGFAVALDGSGKNGFVAGLTDSTNFATTSGAFQTAPSGNSDAFVVQLNETASMATYATYAGGGGTDLGLALAVDEAGAAYLTGLTDSNDFPTTTGAFQKTNGGGASDAFVLKLNPLGTSALGSTYFGGSGADAGFSLKLDKGGNAYLTGTTTSANLPTASVPLQGTSAGGQDAFLAKLNAQGSVLLYGTYLGGGSDDAGFALALDQNNNAYVAGKTNSIDFPTTAGAFQAIRSRGDDAFVLKVSLPASACSYVLGAESRSFPPEGGGSSVTVTTSADCPWTVGSNDSWISILSGSSGSGDGTISYIVAANTSATSRTGTLTLSGRDSASRTFTVVQGSAPPVLQFGSAEYTASEGDKSAQINVVRTGDASLKAQVTYATSDGTARQRTDYTTASGTLSFAPGETSKSFTVILTDNAYTDGDRTVNLMLGNPVGAALSPQSTALLTIRDNDTTAPTTNPADDAEFFVRQQYADFLNRVPDAGGLRYWTNQITQCGANTQCVHERRIGVADAFFFEAEFQLTGAYVYRIHKAARGLRPTFAQFISDRGYIVVGSGLDQSKSDYALVFVQREEFLSLYPRSQTATQFVDALLNSVKLNSGVDLSGDRASLLSLYDGTDAGRASLLRRVADSQAFIDAEYNRSFVLMEYFGYLRRDPDPGGFDFWLKQVNRFPLRDVGIQHAMACSFITSAEYQTRFGSIITHTNRECPQ